MAPSDKRMSDACRSSLRDSEERVPTRCRPVLFCSSQRRDATVKQRVEPSEAGARLIPTASLIDSEKQKQ